MANYSDHSIFTCFRLKIFKLEMTRFTVNLTVNDAFYSEFNCKFMHFTVYLTVKLYKSSNCNFTSIYNSVSRLSLELVLYVL